jgi:50S ribosomal protein L16 3-hydroxylase
VNNSILGGLSPQQFLQEYWQQKPLLIRQAFPTITTPFNAEELAGLACEIDSARIIIEKTKPAWQLHASPFAEEDFLNLPNSHWTLLVNDLEQYYPELSTLITQFNFIPDWRIDDLMVSYAADQGSVGPHTDDYDVFLIQAQGKRHWSLDSQADPTHILTDSDLCILQDFNTTEEWLLEAGDMLYLPPKLAHYGIAQGECMTYSVGFRAPNQQDLIESYLGELAETPTLKKRFSDAKRILQTHSAELTNHDIATMKALLLDALEQNDDFITQWLGKYLTEERQASLNTSICQGYYEKNVNYYRSPPARFIWVEQKYAIQLYYAGKHMTCSKDLLPAIQYLTGNDSYRSEDIKAWTTNSNFIEVFNTLLASGVIEQNE